MSWWQRSARHPADEPVDRWARQTLVVTVPGDSRERVWRGFAGSMGRTPRRPPWELERALWRLRLWTRGLAAGLAVVSAILVIVLLRQHQGRVEWPADDEVRLLETAAPRTGSFLAFDSGGANRRRDLLDDPRIVLGAMGY